MRARQGGAVLGDAFGISAAHPGAGPILFTATFGSLLAFGSEGMVETANGVFVMGVIASFGLLLALAAPEVRKLKHNRRVAVLLLSSLRLKS